MFGRRAPVVLDVGFGRGDALLEAAAARPDRDHVGVEVHAPGIGYLLARAHQRGLDNLRVVFGDARDVLRHRFREAALDEIRLYFPDPWPKLRHHKRRLVQPGFAALLASRLRPGGRFLAATDDEDYALHMRSVLQAAPSLRNLAGEDAFWDGPTERTPTRFEERGRRLGRRIRDLRFERAPDSNARATGTPSVSRGPMAAPAGCGRPGRPPDVGA